MFSEAFVSHSVHRGCDVIFCLWSHVLFGECMMSHALSGLIFFSGVLPTIGGLLETPRVSTSSGGHCSSRYASYWIAFFLPLLLNVFFLLS